MATKKKSIDQKTSQPHAEQISFSVEPGTKLRITLDVGENTVDGRVPVTVHIEQSRGELTPAAEATHPEPKPVAAPRSRWSGLEGLNYRVQITHLAIWLFGLAIAVYLATRLIGLAQFPIYFFTDEAIQSLSMVDLIHNQYRDPAGVWFPTYFRNGDYYNIGLSVYLQWLPVVLFGKSAVATRAMSVLVTLIAAVSVGLILRDGFKLKYWWTGTLFLSITPAWFLHSRTAFETAEFVAFYAGMLCAYLYYRHTSPRYLFLAMFLGALAFYTYSPAQVIVPLTALGLLASDWRYHWENRRTLVIGLGVAVVLALPYVRYMIDNPSTPFAHLHTLLSYWYENIPLSEKIARYVSEFGVGLSPWYWYIPNERDLPRHLMKDYGNIMLATLPFALLGVATTLRNLRLPAYRTVLIALLISPAASALVQISITRTLSFVIPAAILTAIGLENVLSWIEDPQKHLTALREGQGVTSRRLIAAFLILLVGICVALISPENGNRFPLLALTFILALQVSGALERLAAAFASTDAVGRPKLWAFSPTLIALAAFVLLAGANLHMLNDSLKNGPLWFRDYGMGGMQYGGFQIFDIIDQYKREHPEARIILSPDWANGTDVVARFFLDDFLSIQLGSVRGHILQKLPLDEDTLFILTPQEYELAMTSEKLTNVQVERIVSYPDGNPGFYFVHMQYVDHIDEIFAEEKAARQALRESTLTIDGQEVKVRHSFLDSDFQDKSMALVFDHDPFTVAKTLETNPFVIEMTFPEPRRLEGFSIGIGAANVRITLKCYAEAGADPVVHTFEGQGTQNQPELSFDLPAPAQVRVLQMEVLDLQAPEQAKVHIWELTLR